MIRVVNRIAILSLLSLALTGCLRDIGTAPIQPSPVGQGGQPTQVVVNPTALPAVTAQPTIGQQPTSAQPPTVEQPTNLPTALVTEVQPTAVPTFPPLPTDTAQSPPPTEVAPTQQPNIPPTDTAQPPPPTNIPTIAPTIAPTDTPFVPTEVPTIAPTAILPPSETPLPLTSPVATTGTRIIIVTATATLFGTPIGPPPTFAPPQDGATGQLDDQCMYHVEQGDRLLRIALRFNRTILEIVKANPDITNSQLIYLGQTIKIPDCKTR